MDDKVDNRIVPRRESAPPPAPRLAPERRRRRWGWLAALVLVAAAAGLVVWLFPSAPATHQAGRQGRFRRGGAQAQPVAVAKVTQGTIPIVLNALGTVTSLATVTVRSQIGGQLTQIGFQEGHMVKKGDFLAQIDDRAYRAALHQLQGQLERDQALLANARLDLTRYQKLNSQNSVAKQTVDTARATVQADEGTVAADKAEIEAQQVNIANCHIVSPIAGRAGLRQVDAGNYVTPGDANGIVVIAQLQPISVLFALPEDNLAEVMAQVHDGKTLAVSLFDRSDSHQIANGQLATVDNQIDPSTGTVKLRALFANADGTLFPNQFVNARLLVRNLTDATVVPNAAIQHGAPGTFVYLVGADHKVSVRPIKTGPGDATVTQVLSGLAVGDTVVVDGVDRLRDGALVSIPGAAKAGTSDHAGAGAHRGGGSGHRHRRPTSPGGAAPASGTPAAAPPP